MKTGFLIVGYLSIGLVILSLYIYSEMKDHNVKTKDELFNKYSPIEAIFNVVVMSFLFIGWPIMLLLLFVVMGIDMCTGLIIEKLLKRRK